MILPVEALIPASWTNFEFSEVDESLAFLRGHWYYRYLTLWYTQKEAAAKTYFSSDPRRVEDAYEGMITGWMLSLCFDHITSDNLKQLALGRSWTYYVYLYNFFAMKKGPLFRDEISNLVSLDPINNKFVFNQSVEHYQPIASAYDQRIANLLGMVWGLSSFEGLVTEIASQAMETFLSDNALSISPSSAWYRASHGVIKTGDIPQRYTAIDDDVYVEINAAAATYNKAIGDNANLTRDLVYKGENRIKLKYIPGLPTAYFEEGKFRGISSYPDGDIFDVSKFSDNTISYIPYLEEIFRKHLGQPAYTGSLSQLAYFSITDRSVIQEIEDKLKRAMLYVADYFGVSSDYMPDFKLRTGNQEKLEIVLHDLSYSSLVKNASLYMPVIDGYCTDRALALYYNKMVKAIRLARADIKAMTTPTGLPQRTPEEPKSKSYLLLLVLALVVAFLLILIVARVL